MIARRDYRLISTGTFDFSTPSPYNPNAILTTNPVLIDSVLGINFTLFLANGQLMAAAGGGGGLVGLVLLEQGTGTPFTIEMVSGNITVVTGGAGGVASIPLTDMITGTTYNLVIANVGGQATPEVI